MKGKKEDAYIPSQDSTQHSTIFCLLAICTSFKSHDLQEEGFRGNYGKKVRVRVRVRLGFGLG